MPSTYLLGILAVVVGSAVLFRTCLRRSPAAAIHASRPLSNATVLPVLAGTVLIFISGLRCTTPSASHTRAASLEVTSTRTFRLPKAASTGCVDRRYPLDCGNGWCCPPKHTLHCPHSTCKGVPDGKDGCYNQARLTDETLAQLRNCCPELSSCE